MVDLTQILQAIIALIGLLVTGFLIPYLKNKNALGKIILTKEQQEQIKALVSIAVAAAEQIFIGERKGAERKDYVKSFLAEQGFIVESASIKDFLNATIEAAVYELKN